MAENLLPSDEILRTLEKVPNSYLILSPDLYILTASDHYLEATQTDRARIVGKHIFEAFPDNPDTPEADGVRNIHESLKFVLKHKKPHQMVIQKYDVPDNNNPGKFITKYWHPSHTPILHRNGEISYIIQLANDITSQILAENELNEVSKKENLVHEKNQVLRNIQHQLENTITQLAESEIKTMNIVKNAPFPIAVYIGKEMRIEFANKSVMDVWGKGYDVIGKLYTEILPELVGQQVFEQVENVFTTGEPFMARNQPIDLIIDGRLSTFYFNYNFTPLRDSSGKIYGVMNTAADVTDIVNAKLRLEQSEAELQSINEELATSNEELAATIEELQSANEELSFSRNELQESNARFNIALEAGAFGSTEIDLRSGRMMSTKRFKECFGQQTDVELSHPELLELILPAYRKKVADTINHARQNKAVYDITYEVCWPDGSIHWISEHGKARYDRDGVATKIVAIVSEVTESKLNDQRKNDFIGMVSHELKTPLTSLKAIVQVANVKLKESSDTFLAGAMDKASVQVNKMTSMVNSFLNVSRLESNKISIDREDFDLAELVGETQDEVVATVTSHEIIFDPVNSVYINADRNKIGHVITNLISNAVKYSPYGSTINVACTVKDGNAVFSVKDQGIGIEAQDVGRLFERYYRVNDVSTNHISGFGIGLYLSKEIIERHNGTISVDSTPGQGSTFTFTLPVLANQ